MKNVETQQIRDIECPIWPIDPIEKLLHIERTELIWLYQYTFDIDISADVPACGYNLYRNTKADFCFFTPMKAGSSTFYENLYNRKLLYVPSKPEYLWASSFIDAEESILDVGCGIGSFRQFVNHAKFHGIDLNHDSVAQAKESGLNVQCATINEIKKRGIQYDTVTSFQVLEHVDNPKEFFEDCAATVKPGGKLIISVPNLNGYLAVRENTPLNLPPHHVTRWSLRALIRIGNDNGLVVQDYNEEKLESMADYSQVWLKSGLDKFLGRQEQLLRTNFIDRTINKMFFNIGRLMPRPRSSIAPNGHSITVVYKKLISPKQ